MLMIATTIPTVGKMIEPESILINDLENNQETINKIIFKNSEKLILPHQVKTIRHHLLKRQYLLYVPSGYTGDTPVPLGTYNK